MNYKFIGWCREDSHDKVWVVIYLHSQSYVTFWGRRGAKLQSKIVESSNWDIVTLISSKLRKGYKEVQKYELDEVYPEFQSDLGKTKLWAMLKV